MSGAPVTPRYPYREGNRLYYRCEHTDGRGRCRGKALHWRFADPECTTHWDYVCDRHTGKYPIARGIA